MESRDARKKPRRHAQPRNRHPRPRTRLEAIEALEAKLLLTTIVVNTAIDDLTLAVDGNLTLREAILASNTNTAVGDAAAGNSMGGLDTIEFAIGTGPATIRPLAPLPTVTETLFIDGRTQPGYAGTPVVELDGSLAGTGGGRSGLVLAGGSNTVQGLVINRWDQAGISVTGGNHLIRGNYVGTNIAGDSDLGNNNSGISLQSAGNTIGGEAAADANLLSGNQEAGLAVFAPSSGNLIIGNRIGTNAAGDAPIANGAQGIFLSTASNTVGGAAPVRRNLISGNARAGISINAALASGNLIQGNYVGTDGSGAAIVGNGAGADAGGIRIDAGADNTIGGAGAGEGNLVSGNSFGIVLGGASITGTLISGNRIGTDASGTVALPNLLSGVLISLGATANTVGGAAPGAGNLVSGNIEAGIAITGAASTGNLVAGNRVGTDAGGTAALGNGEGGIFVSAPGNTIGGSIAGAGNLVSANTGNGLSLSGASGTLVVGNRIGTDAGGTLAIPNVGHGINVGLGGSNTIGAATGDGRNLVSGNSLNGIFLDTTTGNLVLGNEIGTTLDGAAALGNTRAGIQIAFGGSNTIGGGVSGGFSNLVSANGSHGIELFRTANNAVIGNRVGTDRSGGAALGNAASGIFLGTDSQRNTIGGAGPDEGNLSSGNLNSGIALTGGSSSANLVIGNRLGTDAGGGAAIPNGTFGVLIGGAPNNTVGGSGPGLANLLSANVETGVGILGGGATGNLVAGNVIGTDLTGSTSLGTQLRGIQIFNGASANTIGGDLGSGNFISGNVDVGIQVFDAGSSANLIAGNRVGLDPLGAIGVSNGAAGIQIFAGADANTVGGPSPSARNFVASHTGDGILVESDSNLVAANYIGTDLEGTTNVGFGGGTFLGNGTGIRVTGVGNTIGGTNAEEGLLTAGNLISGNTGDGLAIENGANNSVLGNFIGTDASGESALGNGGGVAILGGTDNTIGSASLLERNVISANGNGGGLRTDEAATGNLIVGNAIGTDFGGLFGIGNVFGIQILGPDNTVGGAASGLGNLITGNGDGVRIAGPSAARNRILGNQIGSDLGGTFVLGNLGLGIAVRNAPDNAIGGSLAGEGNLISGNGNSGVGIFESGSTGNLVAGNRIGTDRTGLSAVPNEGAGIAVFFGASGNSIGDLSAGSANLISGNDGPGILIRDPSTTANLVRNNLIGTSAAGSGALGNLLGVQIDFGATGNTLGGPARNVIAGNRTHGVLIDGANANVVRGNFVGTGVTGAQSLPNQADGILLVNAAGNTIGGTADESGNLISGNLGSGLVLQGSSTTLVAGNRIGTNAAGDAGLGNAGYGVLLQDSANNTIGVAGIGGNLVSANGFDGVAFSGAGTTGNRIANAFVGTDATGTFALGNSFSGVVVFNGATDNAIGAPDPALRNVISGNFRNGVSILGVDAARNRTINSLIGTRSDGAAALPNQFEGVFIEGADNTVGGIGPNLRNVVSGNRSAGIVIASAAASALATGNLIAGNFIGTSTTGNAVLPNLGEGIILFGGASQNSIAGNVISGNLGNGVSLDGSSQSEIAGNTIGLGVDGSTALGNSLSGVLLANGSAANTIGGSALAARNVIGSNSSRGVLLRDETSSGNLIAGNFIGTDATGTLARANLGGIDINGAPNNTVGGPDPGAGNLTSGNSNFGINLAGETASGTLIHGNRIGTEVMARAALANVGPGIQIDNASGTVIRQNYISGNSGSGINIQSDGPSAISSGTRITGNLIGVNAAGSAAVPNALSGIFIQNAVGTIIGGPTMADRNLISGNGEVGINQNGVAASGTLIQGNYIGTDTSGTLPLGNAFQGIFLGSTSNNTVGGLRGSTGNLISANGNNGVAIAGSSASNNVVSGNLIGTDQTGALPLGNAFNGVFVGEGSGFSIPFPGAARFNTIGGTDALADNVIAGNAQHGIFAAGVLGDGDHDLSGNAILGNFIGTNPTGDTGLGNLGAGILIFQADGVQVGGSGFGFGGNVISGNARNGIRITDGRLNQIVGNRIGLAPNAGIPLSNGTSPVGGVAGGILLDSASDNFLVQNTVAGHVGFGVRISGTRSTGNRLTGNILGDPNNAALGNQLAGLSIVDARDNEIGFGFVGNIIANNIGAGVEVLQSAGQTDPTAGTGNSILANSIFGNGGLGIDLGPVIAGQGPNLSQPAPILTGLFLEGPMLRVTGTFTGVPGGEHTLQFFSNDAGPTDSIEGRTFLGEGFATADAVGVGTFSILVSRPSPFSLQRLITATITDPNANTSEFSAPRELPGSIGFNQTFASIAENYPGGQLPITLFRQDGAGGRVSADFVATGVNATAGVDFVPLSGTVVFEDGQTSATIILQVLDNPTIQGLRLLDITLSNPQGGTEITASTIRVAIDDDESPAPFVVGITGSSIGSFYTANPGEFFDTFQVTGLETSEERLIGIDFRPADRLLYGISDAGRLYTIDFRTGRATRVGGGSTSPDPMAEGFGFDFNPTVDRIRLIDDFGQSQAVNPVDGNSTSSPTLAYASDDVNAGQTPSIVGVAYTNSVQGASSTTLFGIDQARANLVTINPATGIVRTVGGQAVGGLSLSPNFGTVGFDITPDNANAFIVVSDTNQDAIESVLYLIDLTTGRATRVDTVSSLFNQRAPGLAIIPRGPITVSPFVPSVQPVTTLTDALVVPGSGLNIDNAASAYVGVAGQAGTYRGFNLTAPGLTTVLPDGILLTSGQAQFAAEPNVTGGRTFRAGGPGDIELSGLIGFSTNDANSITIQFTADPGILSIQFQLLFASEEFPRFVGAFNDAFAVFLDGVQISFDSLGQLLTVNNNFFQLNNTGLAAPGDPEPALAGKTSVDYSYQSQYGGLTSGLITAAPLDLSRTIHTLKFVIADAVDQSLDSAIFLSQLRGLDCRVDMPGTQLPTDVAVTKTASAPSVTAGDPVTFTITTSNLGSGTATDIVLTDALPAGFEFVSASAGTFADGVLTVPIGNLAPGASTVITLVAIPRVAGEFINTADAGDVCFDINPANNSGSVAILVLPSVPPVEFDFIVRNTNDSGPGSLRQAILEANAIPGRDTIIFELFGPGPFTVQLLSALPVITDSIVLDTRPFLASPLTLDGSAAGAANGLHLLASRSIVGGLAIDNFQLSGLVIEGGGFNQVVANRIGSNDPAGNVVAAASAGNAMHGILVINAAGNTLGGPVAGLGNVVAGNGIDGIVLFGPGSVGNLIAGNAIGTGPAGLVRNGNRGAGVRLDGAGFNLIGGLDPAARNLISDNAIGLEIGGPSASGNIVRGNYFGLSADATRTLGNRVNGIFIDNAPGNQVGGSAPGAANVIVDSQVGIQIEGPQASGNAIQGNFIGTDPTGDRALPNSLDGIYIENAPNNLIGGLLSGQGNLIAGNDLVNLQITGPQASGNLVLGNRIGTDAAGTRRLGSTNTGIFIENAPANVIGLPIEGAGNVVSGNTSAGIYVFGPGSVGNTIQNNRIGTDAAGIDRIANNDGVLIDNAPGNTVGGFSPLSRNLISGNQVGVRIAGQTATVNQVLGNFIGTDAAGTGRLPNTLGGVFISNAPSNIVGLPGAGNVISGNGGVGIQIFEPDSGRNRISANRIGTDVTGTLPLGNADGGIFINNAPDNTVGGTAPGEGNQISANGGGGIQVFGPGASGNVIVGNTIGSENDGRADLGNQIGLFVNLAAEGAIGGSSVMTGNVIRNNRFEDVLVLGQGQGPRVSAVSPIFEGGSIVAFRFDFSERLNQARAERLRNYRVNVRTGRRLGRAVRLVSATYDDINLSVTVRLAQPLAATGGLRVTAVGTGGAPIIDRRNLSLDGDRDGSPGGNFTADFMDGVVVTTPRRVSAAAVDQLLSTGLIRIARRR